MSIHITDRPSEAVEDRTVRLVLKGWLGQIFPREESEPGTHQYWLPSTRGRPARDGEPVRYLLTHRWRDGTLACTCPAGIEGVHCTHLTLLQLREGWWFNSDTGVEPQSPRPADGRTQNRPPAVEEVADDSLVAQLQIAEPVQTTHAIQFGTTRCGVWLKAWEEAKRACADGHDHLSQIQQQTLSAVITDDYRDLLTRTVQRADGTCGNCTEEMAALGTDLLECSRCAIIVPTAIVTAATADVAA